MDVGNMIKDQMQDKLRAQGYWMSLLLPSGDAIAYAKSKHVAMIPVDRNITGGTGCKDVGPQLGSDFVLQGSKLTGGYALTRTGERRWVLVKVRDEAARPGSDIVAERPASVRSGRTWRELAGQ